MAMQELKQSIKNLLNTESFAVLCTQTSGQLHTCLITYAVSEDYRTLIFATEKNTQKFKNIATCEEIQLLIDDREQHPGNVNEINALTITGTPAIPHTPEDIEKWKTFLTNKQPDIKNFTNNPETAIILVNISDYKLVNKHGDSFIASLF